jgi:hypothetical protein
MNDVIATYLDLLDNQRETAFAALEGLTEAQIWQRPAPKEWSLGEILDHNYLLVASFLPLVSGLWHGLGWYGKLRRRRPYAVEIEDVYRREGFPMWVGFLWTPRHNQRKPVPLAQLQAEARDLHRKVRAFYTGKDPDVLGNLYLYDPVFGWCNLIVTLRISIYHDQLHFTDVLQRARQPKNDQE